MTERRYDDDETREIFDRAARAETTARGDGGAGKGLTLRELQEIGSEAGLSPEAIARAAAALEAAPSGTRLTYLGFPVGVTKTVPLQRTMTDVEWSWLVVRLRETFRARGRVDESGRLREWWNGNLRVTVEPTPSGDVLHMSTVKGGTREGVFMGAAMMGMALVAVVALAVTGELAADPDVVAVPLLLGAAGLGAVLTSTLRLPRWFRTRKVQFEALARSVLSRGPGDRDDESLRGDGPGASTDDGLLSSPGTG